MPVLDVLFAVLLFIGVTRVLRLQSGIDLTDRSHLPITTVYSVGVVYSRLLSLCLSGFCGMLRLGCMDHGFFNSSGFCLYVLLRARDSGFGYSTSIE